MSTMDASLTRLCVKGLPKHCTDARLRSHFGSALTDAKVMRTPDGTSRLFGFIGFATHDEAARALQHWNGAYMDTSKLHVEWARAVGDEGIPRAWSKYTKNKEQLAAEQQQLTAPAPTKTSSAKRAAADAVDEDERERKFQEFLALAKPSKKSKAWENVDGGEAAVTPADGDDQLDDLAWLRSKMRDAPPVAAAGTDDKSASATDAAATGPSSATPDTAKIAETRRLLVRNLAPQCDEAAVRAAFAPLGELDEVSLVAGKGFAFVRYTSPGPALRAYAELDGTILLGRLLHVVAADARRGESDGGGGDERERSTSSFKRQQQQLRRKTAASNDSNSIFSALYVDANAAAAVMAASLCVAKGDLLGSERVGNRGATVAVTAALAETQVAATVRDWLERNGINTDAATATAAARSDTTLLVKNLPAHTSEAQMEELFVEHGDVLRLLVAPGGTLALVEYAAAAQAQRAYRALAFHNYRGTPLYLQWAPLNVFRDKAAPTQRREAKPAAAAAATKPAAATAAVAAAPRSAAAVAVVQELAAEPDVDEEDGPTTLFVKNLSFATAQAALSELFVGARAATVVSKMGKSLGYGFVEFPSGADALRALKAHQGAMLDGHALQLSLSTKSGGAPAVAGKKAPKARKSAAAAAPEAESAKLMVRNIPFEASKAELQALFAAYGSLKSLRLPLKFDRSHRGFCFVELASRAEARKVKEALAATHLYGRHLVIEYAQADDGVEDTRAKTKQKFAQRGK